MSNFLSSLAQRFDETQEKMRPRVSSLKIAKSGTPYGHQPDGALPATSPDDLQKIRNYLRLLGLFDQDYYVAAYPDISQANVDPSNGKRLLEQPLKKFLQTGDIDMPFCLRMKRRCFTTTYGISKIPAIFACTAGRCCSSTGRA